MFLLQCEKCKVQSMPTTEGWRVPDDWRNLEYRLKGYGSTIRTYHLCAPCAKAMNLPEDKKVSLADQFLDILSELAAEAVDDAIANQ